MGLSSTNGEKLELVNLLRSVQPNLPTLPHLLLNKKVIKDPRTVSKELQALLASVKDRVHDSR